jgi:hypothetical protein
MGSFRTGEASAFISDWLNPLPGGLAERELLCIGGVSTFEPLRFLFVSKKSQNGATPIAERCVLKNPSPIVIL